MDDNITLLDMNQGLNYDGIMFIRINGTCNKYFKSMAKNCYNKQIYIENGNTLLINPRQELHHLMNDNLDHQDICPKHAHHGSI